MPRRSPAPGDKGALRTAERMAEARTAAARRDFEEALGIWVVFTHAGIARAQAEIGRCFVNGWQEAERRASLPLAEEATP